MSAADKNKIAAVREKVRLGRGLAGRNRSLDEICTYTSAEVSYDGVPMLTINLRAWLTTGENVVDHLSTLSQKDFQIFSVSIGTLGPDIEINLRGVSAD